VTGSQQLNVSTDASARADEDAVPQPYPDELDTAVGHAVHQREEESRPSPRRRRDTLAPRSEPLVLVASGVDDTLKVVRGSLAPEGFAIAEAGDGPTALAMLQRLRPDAVLLDTPPATAGGFETCARMLARLQGVGTPLILMVAAESPDAMRRAHEVGATGFVTKPLHAAALAHSLRCTLRQAARHEHRRRSEERLRQLADHLDQVFVVMSDDGREIIYVSRAYEALTGRTCRSLYEQPSSYAAGVHPEDRDHVAAEWQRECRVDSALEYRVIDARGAEHWVRERRHSIAQPHGRGRWRASVIEDITVRKHGETRIRYLADYDGLTALPNRSLFKRTLERAIVCADRDHLLVATLFLDLDHFKRINDTLGHSAGDELLHEVAVRLRRCVRASDSVTLGTPAVDATSVARLGGDEFTVILDALTDCTSVAAVAQRILDAIAEPFELGGQDVVVTASIGASVYPLDGLDVDTLLKHADVAMYAVKDAGRNGYRAYRGTMGAGALERFTGESRLRKALDRHELVLHYQPEFDTATGTIRCLEALVRWQDGDRLVPPLEFIPLAEETGLIVPLGDWVLRAACAQSAAWDAAGRPAARLAVNLSARQLRAPGFAERVAQILYQTGMPAERLELELTESMLMQDAGPSMAALRALRDLRIRIVLDDFGTGYSSLSYLTRLPITDVKIDRSFVREVPGSPHACAIVRAIIAMAQSLGLGVIAEGVEQAAQLRFLQAEGCFAMQGYLLGRPCLAPYAQLG
jgi:diguanylate cyclase (GGDEF)-like protein/PAS domain S-box-containing protein